MGKAIPDWISDPKDKIYGYITTYLIGLIAGVVIFITDTIGSVFDVFQSAIRSAGQPMIDAIVSVTESTTDVFDTLTMAVVDIAQFAGPFAPLVIGVIIVGGLALTYRVIMSISDSIPVLSSIENFIEG